MTDYAQKIQKKYFSNDHFSFMTSTDTFVRVMAHMDALQVNDVLGEMFKFIQRESNRGLTIDRIKAGSIINVSSAYYNVQ